MNPLGALTGRLAAQGVHYAPEIVQAAAKHGLDPALLAAVAAQETGGPGANGGRNVVGDGGHGRGLFQIDDRWHEFAKTGAAMNPSANADYAAGMLSGLLRRYGGNVRAALSAYNSGSPDGAGTETTWGDGQTLDYADSVLRHYQQLEPHQGRPQRMSINLIGALTGGVEGLVSGLFGGSTSAASATDGIDPTSLESALSQQSSAFTNINTLSSYAQSQPQSDNLLASLIDGDDSNS
ncbi:MAG TPA: transglycosylase SLT domain-containing protein [Candidatus Baltobacteraceae bacterium]|nr:transglycosylase SLT domain-containing protein [Candidatus Baltobacteraceae bacterium]